MVKDGDAYYTALQAYIHMIGREINAGEDEKVNQTQKYAIDKKLRQ